MRYLDKYAVAVALALSVGCSKTDNLPEPLQPLQFAVSREMESHDAQPTSRAAVREESFISSDVIGIFGYYFDGSWVANNWMGQEPNFINHDNLRDEDGYWTLGNPRYWPTEGDPQLRTFAYYPYNEACTPTYSTGYPSISFTVASKSHNQVDFMTANPSELWNKESEVIKLSFKRQLARINFSVEQTGTKIKILGIECPSAKCRAVGCFTESGFEWTSVEETLTTITAQRSQSESRQVIETNTRTQLANDYTLLLLPDQTIPAGSSFKLKYLNMYADGTTEERASIANLINDLTLVKGETYNIPFFVDNAYLF